jgi:hypothetical protein
MRSLAIVGLALALSAASTPAFGQETTGAISGRVLDAQELAVPGVTVTATGPQGTMTAVTDQEGRYRFPFVTPGTYAVRFELSGFRSVDRQNVGVRLGQTVDLDVTLEAGGIEETVQVVGDAAVIDSRSTTTGATFDAELFERTPVGRRLSDTIYLAPGVNSGGGSGQANPAISGGSGLENQYVIDGVNITNAGYGALGSYSIVFGSLGNGTPFDFIKEVQVKTGGYEAEYGQSTGGVVNVITRSGTNVFTGSAFAYARPEFAQGTYEPIVLENLTNTEAVNIESETLADAGFRGGGPILRDRLFFFAAVDPQWETRTYVAPEGLPLASLGEVDRERRTLAYSAKLSSQLQANHRIDVSLFGDPSTGVNGPQRRASLLGTDTAGFSELDFGGHNQIVKYDGVITPTWLIEASIARAGNSIEETPSVDEWFVEDTITERLSGGIGFYEVGNDGTNVQYSAKSRHFLGDHLVSYGLLFEDITYDNTIDRTGPAFILHNGEETATGASVQVRPDAGLGQFYRVVRANTSNVRNTEQQYFSFFVQDTFAVTSRLTVNPGLRYEQQRLVGNLDEFTWDGNWAPRIGLTYDVVGDGSSKAYFNWGRFFAKIPNDLAARALSADAGVTRADYYDANLTMPIPDGVEVGGTTTHFILAGTSAADFDPDSRSTYLDEFVAGYEFEAAPGLNLGARYINRRFGRVLEDVGTAPLVAYFLGIPGLDSVEYFITNPDTDTPTVTDIDAAFEEAIHEYDAVEITADKRMSNNWQLQGSYRWSRLHGTFEGFFRNDNGQSDPAITSLFDFPTNDPSYTEIGVPQFGFRGDIRYLGALGAGPLPNDRPHQVKVFSNYMFDMGLNLGLGVNVGSGRPLTPLAANPAYDNAGEIPEAPRGSGFETVDGFRERAPMESSLDIHLDYRFPFAGTRDMSVVFDAFNLFNRQGVLRYDDRTETSFEVLNSDFGRVLEYQNPLQMRFGVRFRF